LNVCLVGSESDSTSTAHPNVYYCYNAELIQILKESLASAVMPVTEVVGSQLDERSHALRWSWACHQEPIRNDKRLHFCDKELKLSSWWVCPSPKKKNMQKKLCWFF